LSATLAISGRELRAFFLSPGGYVVAALFMLANGWFFVRHVFGPGEMATLRPVFAFSMVVFVLVCPALTMKMISEELRLGTIETLFTCPITETQIVLGKFAAALAFLSLLLVPTAVFVAALEIYGRPDYGELLCGYLGVILAASLFLASGMLASALTANQVVAYLITVFFWLLVILLTRGLPQSDLLPVAWRDAAAGLLAAIDPDRRMRDFSIGLVDTANVVYFVSATAVLLAAAIQALALRRWR
jgi:ABC-2 type transport system permease protein